MKIKAASALFNNTGFNPYSTGFSSFIVLKAEYESNPDFKFQSLFYWILFFYNQKNKRWIKNP